MIPRQQIEDKAYRDVTDALKDCLAWWSPAAPAVQRHQHPRHVLQVHADPGGRQRVDTRGTRPNSDNAGIEQGWLPPMEAIERIEVVRGPMSSLYGSDAMGGVINVITRKTSRTEWKARCTATPPFRKTAIPAICFQTNAYASDPLIEGLLGVRVNGLLSRRAEDKITNGYNEQRMRSGTAVFTLTPDEKNEFDFEIGRSLQDRNSHLGKSRSPTMTGDNLERHERTNYALTHNGYYDFSNTTSYIQREETKIQGANGDE